MSDDLVKRLRDWENVYAVDDDKPEGSLYIEAADRIEELEARHANDCEEIAKWREIVSGRTISENFEVVWRERVNRLEAKLAKAMELLNKHCDPMDMSYEDETTLTELKGDPQ